jgi:hypothetical protein
MGYEPSVVVVELSPPAAAPPPPTDTGEAAATGAAAATGEATAGVGALAPVGVDPPPLVDVVVDVPFTKARFCAGKVAPSGQAVPDGKVCEAVASSTRIVCGTPGTVDRAVTMPYTCARKPFPNEPSSSVHVRHGNASAGFIAPARAANCINPALAVSSKVKARLYMPPAAAGAPRISYSELRQTVTSMRQWMLWRSG